MTLTPPLDAPALTPGEPRCAELGAVCGVLEVVAAGLARVASDDLAGLAAAARVVAVAEAARAAVVLEARSRGVIATSDHPRVEKWVEQSCREGGAPVARGQARHIGEVARVCDGYDVSALREAITAGRVPLESAATVAKVFRRLKAAIEYPHWDALMETLVEWAAEGASARELVALEDALIGRYGPEGELDDEHGRLHARRELSGFHRDRTGMLTATLRLDPASEAVFSAAITALSAPQPDDDGRLDERTPGQRRADALLTLAGMATTPNAAVPGSGAKARIVVTLPLDTLTSRLTGRGLVEEEVDVVDGRRGYAVAADGRVLSPTEARILACDAQIIPAVLGSKGELLDLGHAKRLVTPGLAAALHVRDGGCTYPQCTAPPSWCDGHHIVHWARGGPTDLANLALLCRHHHTVVHRHDHTATVDADGVHWTRRDGSPIGNAPRRWRI